MSKVITDKLLSDIKKFIIDEKLNINNPLDERKITLSNKILNGEEVDKNELNFIKLVIEEKKLDIKKEANRKKMAKLKNAEKAKSRRYIEHQKYVIGAITIKILNEVAIFDPNQLAVLKKNFLDGAKESDKKIINDIFDEAEKLAKEYRKKNTNDLARLEREYTNNNTTQLVAAQSEPPEPDADYYSYLTHYR